MIWRAALAAATVITLAGATPALAQFYGDEGSAASGSGSNARAAASNGATTTTTSGAMAATTVARRSPAVGGARPAIAPQAPPRWLSAAALPPTDRHRQRGPAALLHPVAHRGATLSDLGRPRGLHLDRHRNDQPQGRMAGLASAGGDARRDPTPAREDDRRHQEPAWRHGALSRQLAVPHPRHQRSPSRSARRRPRDASACSTATSSTSPPRRLGTPVTVVNSLAPQTVSAARQPIAAGDAPAQRRRSLAATPDEEGPEDEPCRPPGHDDRFGGYADAARASSLRVGTAVAALRSRRGSGRARRAQPR